VEEWRSAAGRRVLIRPSVRCGARYRLRQVVGGLALVVASAAAVVALGLLARAAEPEGMSAGHPASTVVEARPPAPVVVTAESGETVWEVASRVAPGLSGPQRAALAERIVADNALSSVRLRSGQVLRVAVG
jgi:Tfp pilus assembly protein FimV